MWALVIYFPKLLWTFVHFNNLPEYTCTYLPHVCTSKVCTYIDALANVWLPNTLWNYRIWNHRLTMNRITSWQRINHIKSHAGQHQTTLWNHRLIMIRPSPSMLELQCQRVSVGSPLLSSFFIPGEYCQVSPIIWQHLVGATRMHRQREILQSVQFFYVWGGSSMMILMCVGFILKSMEGIRGWRQFSFLHESRKGARRWWWSFCFGFSKSEREFDDGDHVLVSLRSTEGARWRRWFFAFANPKKEDRCLLFF